MLGLEIAWQWPPALVVVGVLVATKLYVQAFSRLRRRGRSDHASAGRVLAFGVALVIGVLALVSPLDRIAEQDLLSAHMLQHVLIGDLVPALIVVAVRGPIAFH